MAFPVPEYHLKTLVLSLLLPPLAMVASRSPHKLVWLARHRCSNAKYVGSVASDATCARGVACGNGRIETTLKRWISAEIYGSNSK